MMGIHPIFLIAAATLIASIACMTFAYLATRWLTRGFLIVIAIILLVPAGFVITLLKPELVDARFRTYKRLYSDIEVGMSRTEVMGLVEKHYPDEGRRLPPKLLENSAARLDFFMNPEKSREPNCEGIFLRMQDDAVTKKSYSAD